MIGRLLPGAHVGIDADIDQSVAGLRRHQQVIGAQAPILLPGAGLIVPEGVLARRVGDGAERSGEAEAEQRLKAFARRRAEEGVMDPGWRVVDVSGGRDDVKVACEDQRLFRFKSLPRLLK